MLLLPNNPEPKTVSDFNVTDVEKINEAARVAYMNASQNSSSNSSETILLVANEIAAQAVISAYSTKAGVVYATENAGATGVT